MCALTSPVPQNSDGISCERTARQKADVMAAGVACFIIEGLRSGTCPGGVHGKEVREISVATDICVLNVADESKLGAVTGILEAESRIYKSVWSTY